MVATHAKEHQENRKNPKDCHKDRQKEMESLTLTDRRERLGLITMYKLVNSMEKMDRQGLISLIEVGDRWTREHSKNIRKSQCL